MPCRSAVWVGWPEKGGQVLMLKLELPILLAHGPGMAMDGWGSIKRSFTTSRLIDGVFRSKNARICWQTYRYVVGKV